MKNIFKSSLCILIVSLTIILSIPTSAAKEFSTPTPYGRDALSLLPKGDTYVEAYDRVYDGVALRNEAIDLSDLSITCSELTGIMAAYFGDPTGHFWTTTNYSYSYDSHVDKIYSVYPAYNSLTNESYEEPFKKAANDLIRSLGISPSMSDYQKAKLIHDAIIMRTDYVRDAENAHNIYGTLIDKKAVCEGYTFTYSYLLSLVGIQSHGVFGSADGEGHVWNLVCLDGEYCYTDLTWDDQTAHGSLADKSEIFYAYFNITEGEMKEDHYFNNIIYALPQNTVSKFGYFQNNPERVFDSLPSADELVSLIEYESIRISSESLTNDLIYQWFNKNAYDFFSKAGYDLSKDIGISISNLKNEHHIRVLGTLIPPEFLAGDLDANGVVDSKDANILSRILCGIYLPNARESLAADLTGDSSINAKDYNILKRMVLGQ